MPTRNQTKPRKHRKRRKMMAFRFSPHFIEYLDWRSRKTGKTKTSIIEEAVLT